MKRKNTRSKNYKKFKKTKKTKLTKKQEQQALIVEHRRVEQIKSIIFTGIIMTIGLLLFKFLPMQLFGSNILSDASMHITLACFILYIGYFFIDQNKSWRIPYFIFCLAVLTIIALQRILVNAHNDLGLLAGLLLSLLAIVIGNWENLRGEIDF